MRVKVRVNEGFSSIEHGSYGPGETEMPLAVAEKYACFVTIIEDKKGKVATKKVATIPSKKRAPRKRKA